MGTMKMDLGVDIREAKRTDIGSFAATIARTKTIGKLTPKTYLNWIVREGFAFVAEDSKEQGRKTKSPKKNKKKHWLFIGRKRQQSRCPR